MLSPFATLADVQVGPLRWTSLPPAWMLVLLTVVGFLWIRMLYGKERGRAGPMQRFVLTFLRTAVLLLILLILGAPYREETRTTPDPAHLVVLIDTSASMETADTYPEAEDQKLREKGWPARTRPSNLGADGISRAELVRQYLAGENDTLLASWAERFVLHTFVFDGDWRSLGPPIKPGEAPESRDGEPVPDPIAALGDKIRTLDFSGGRTRLGALLRNVASEYGRRQDRNVAGVLLLSDGRDTSEGESPLDALALLGPVKEDLRITPVLVGNPASGKNMWVERIRAKDEVLVRDEVLFETGVRQKGYGASISTGDVSIEDLPVRMTVERVEDEHGNKVEPPEDVTEEIRRASRRTQIGTSVDVPADEDTPVAVRMRATFVRAGRYLVRIRAHPEEIGKEDALEQDNERVHRLRVVKTKINVLYVENRPTFDWRFLQSHLTREPHDDGSAERAGRNRYAVHVLLQQADPGFAQPSSVGLRPLKQFPRTRKELFKYDVIILGDVLWREFHELGEGESRRLLELLVEFVESGGGLALQAGTDYNNPISFLGTPLGQLLPIAAHRDDARRSESDDLSREFNIRLTEPGMRHPIFAIVPGTAEEPIPTPEVIQKTWSGKTDLSERWSWYWLYRASGGVRPGTVPLAVVDVPVGDERLMDSRGRPLVVFSTMNFGRGRVFWSSLDYISRIRVATGDEFYGAFWEQVIRYLATYRLLGGNTRYKIFTDEDEYFVGSQAEVTISALDEDFEPLDVEYLDGVRIESPKGETIERIGDNRPVSLKREGHPGQYRFYLPLKEEGVYRIWLEHSSASATARGSRERAEKTFTVTFRAKERVEKIPDLDTLKRIAKETNPGGHEVPVLRLYDMADYVAKMQDRTRERVLERKDRQQWDKWWVLFLLVGLLGLEWALRKRWQMI